MKKSKRICFILTKEQWLGVIILGILVIGVLVVVKKRQPTPEASSWSNNSTKNILSKHQSQFDSTRYATQENKYYSSDTIAIHMHTFDPNTIDSLSMLSLGFKPWQAKNMLKYRTKGGKFRKAEDIKKLYGMTDSMYRALVPYVQIARDTNRLVQINSAARDSISPIYPEKKDTILNLRTADTTELKLIRGIGSYRAKKIVEYRNKLGGFYDVKQLIELPCFQSINTDSILCHFFIDTIMIEPIYVNSASIQRLTRHPYMRFEEAKAIYEFRRKHIRLKSLSQLQKVKGLSVETLQKIAPYLNFDKK